jgi:hypothetical protein
MRMRPAQAEDGGDLALTKKIDGNRRRRTPDANGGGLAPRHGDGGRRHGQEREIRAVVRERSKRMKKLFLKVD